MKAVTPADVLKFWQDAGPQRWFKKDAAFDEEIRRRFLRAHEAAAAGRLAAWEMTDDGTLALLILLDQFPRNMFRGDARSFATDPLALDAARRMVGRSWDKQLASVEKAFAYLPFEHSENLADQDRSVALFASDPSDAVLKGYTDYAIKHRDFIARFGRFPHRNAIVGRASTSEELEFLSQPGSSF